MSLTLIAIIIAAVAMFGGMIKAYSIGESRGEAKITAAYAAAEKKAEELAAKLEKEGRDHIDDMVGAFNAGEDTARQALAGKQAKGTSDVTKFAVFQNPVCTLPDESLLNLNAARASIFGGVQPSSERSSTSLSTTTNPSQSAGAVPSSGNQPITGRQDSNSVPAVNQGHRPLGAVRPEASGVSNNSQVPR